MSATEKLETIVLQLPTVLDAALAAQAARSGQSKSDIVTAILQAHLILEVPSQTPDPGLSSRLTALQERLTQMEHNLAYYQLMIQKQNLKSAPVIPIADDGIEDEPDEVLEGFL